MDTGGRGRGGPGYVIYKIYNPQLPFWNRAVT
jgi:hypothetical protein